MEHNTQSHRLDQSRPLVSRILEFDIFKSEYWCQFPRNLTKNLSVELVFAEVMGVIKGSISSADTLASLSRDQYLRMSCRLAPSFATESDREKIYDIFECYEKIKHGAGEIDQIDRVTALLAAIKYTPGLSEQLAKAFEEVYVDGLRSKDELEGSK